MTNKHVMWMFSSAFIIANLLLLNAAFNTWGPIKRVESIVSDVTPKIMQIINTQMSSSSPELLIPKPLIVVWDNDGSFFRDVQQLLPTRLWPKNKDDISYLVVVTRTNVRDGTYNDNQPGYQISYTVTFVSYLNIQKLAQTVLNGSPSPYSKQYSGPAYGSPPDDSEVANWIKTEIGVQE